MTTDFVIRPARAGDATYLPAVEMSASEAFRIVPGLEWIADGDDIISVEEHVQYIDQGTVWVAETSNQIIGFVTTQYYPDENSLHIWELSVAIDHQGKGVGGELMNAARAYALDKDLSVITLTTFRELAFNEGFYQRLGYCTLTDNEVSDRLGGILAREAENGLPADRRCAMRLKLV